MQNSRNQLIIAIVFALLLGLIIVFAARFSGSRNASTPPRTTPAVGKTATVKVTPPKGTAAVATATALAAQGALTPRPTDGLMPPAGTPAATSTPISVGPLPPATIVAGATQATGGLTQPPVIVAVTATPIRAAVAATPTKTALPQGGATYTVVTGDTLGGIAQKFGVTSQVIIDANNITDPSRIIVGQQLRIPGATGGAASGSPTVAGKVYVVKSGDTLSKIAQANGTTVAAIVKANNLTNANVIRVGQKLIIPPK
jgi:LysM repeat protein